MAEFKLPDQVKVNQWGTQLRYGAIALGAMGIGGTWGQKITGLSESDLNQYVTAGATTLFVVIWVGSLVWGWVNNFFIDQDIKEVIVASSVASAEIGKPVVAEVIQTEKGINNIALPMAINATEVYNAAVVPLKMMENEKSTNELNQAAFRRQGDEVIR